MDAVLAAKNDMARDGLDERGYNSQGIQFAIPAVRGAHIYLLEPDGLQFPPLSEAEKAKHDEALNDAHWASVFADLQAAQKNGLQDAGGSSTKEQEEQGARAAGFAADFGAIDEVGL